MAIKKKRGRVTYWRDGEGSFVPEKYVPDYEKVRDRLVSQVFKRVEKLERELLHAKEEISKELFEYLADIATEYGENWQGNALLRDFSQEQEIQIKKNKKLAFDERLQLAKAKIDSYIESLLRGQAKDLQTLVNDAFRLDRKGDVDVKQILRLRHLEIKHPEWQSAMKLIDASLRVESTKTYYLFRTRTDEHGWETKILNFNALKGEK